MTGQYDLKFSPASSKDFASIYRQFLSDFSELANMEISTDGLTITLRFSDFQQVTALKAYLKDRGVLTVNHSDLWILGPWSGSVPNT